MSTDLEVVRDAFAAFGRGDLESWIELLHPEVEWVSDDLTGPRTYRGHSGAREWARDVLDDLSDVELEIHELVAVRDRVFVAFGINARGRTSGIAGSVQRGAVAVVRGGLIAYYRSYMDEGEARAAAGLPER